MGDSRRSRANTSARSSSPSKLSRYTIRNEAPKLDSQSLLDVPPEIDITTFISKYYLDIFDGFTELEANRFLSGVDVLELLENVQKLKNDLATLKLENYILIAFLEKNDPKLLVGVKQRRLSMAKKIEMKLRQSSAPSSDPSSRTSLKRSMAMSVMSGAEKRGRVDIKINYKTKAELAEKTAAEVEKRVSDIEHNATVEVKQLRAKVEELRYRSEETIETEKNFMLHFLRDQNDLLLLESGTERQIERKLKKFTANWFKNARALLGKMRLTIISLQESCQQYRADLITKADLSGILTAIDFEKLIIKRTELLNELEEKNTHMSGLKGVTGKTSLAMTEEKQLMMSLESEYRSVICKTEEIGRGILKLQKEVGLVQVNNDKDRVILGQLRDQLAEYEAPSITQYIERKEEAISLEKEEKMLQRKIYILHMKLNNVVRRFRRRSTDY